MAQTDMTVANTILQQLGGRRFSLMTGAKDFLGTENSLQFKLGRNKTQTNRVRIVLEPSDTYTVYFEKVSVPRVNSKGEFVDGKVKLIAKHDDIYCDVLTDVFTRVTGMYTSL
jgi:hypothetical protein